MGSYPAVEYRADYPGDCRGDDERGVGAPLFRSEGAGCKLNFSENLMSNLVKSKTDVLSVIQQNRKSIKTLGVKKLGLFGSFVREEHNKNSDIDLMVEFDKGKKTFDNFMQLSFLLEDLLGKKVELVTTDAMSPYIRPYILKEVEYVNFTS